MKRIIFNGAFALQFFLTIVTMIFISSCEDEDAVSGPPIINEVRNYAASPDDTVVQVLNTGQWVVLKGGNLMEVSQVYFNSVPAAINNSLFSDESIVVQVPSIPFQSISADAFNEITVVNEKGAVTYTIEIVGEPSISYVRNYAASPNDTILNAIEPGQQINIIGFNLENATEISFQGIGIDLASVVYTDTSAIVQVPDDFKEGDLSQKNTINYTTAVGSGSFLIKIILPEIEVSPFLALLTGGVGAGKTWTLDFDSDGASIHFLGPLYFSGDELRWEYGCATEGGNCGIWEAEWQGWMPGPADYGTMTFSVGEDGTIVIVNQKEITDSGVFEGNYALSEEAKTLSFAGLKPLNMGWDNVAWSKAYVINLTEDAMQLGFIHTTKTEMEIYNYIAK